MLPSSATPAPRQPAQPTANTQLVPAPSSRQGGLGAPSQPRQRLTRPLNQFDQHVGAAHNSHPSSPSGSGGARLHPASGAWRWRCVALAQRRRCNDAAMYLGLSARGEESFAVASQRIAGLRYRVTFRMVGAEPHWRCECQQGALRQPCSHVGAALLLAAARAEVIEAAVAALNAGLTAGHVRFRSGAANGFCYYLAPVSARTTWDTYLVTWDPRPGRNVATHCTCGEVACIHIGAVSLRREHDEQQRARAMRFGERPWEQIQSAAL